jgi:hypothetical protein
MGSDYQVTSGMSTPLKNEQNARTLALELVNPISQVWLGPAGIWYFGGWNCSGLRTFPYSKIDEYGGWMV